MIRKLIFTIIFVLDNLFCD